MKTIIKMQFIITIALVISILVSSCHWNKTAKGGAIGAAAGGAVGGAIGSRSDNTVVGAIIGAAVGGATGAAIGRYMDKQAEELQRDLKNAKVERVGEGIKITFDSGILFDVGSYELKAEAKNNIQDLAKVLKKYEDTNVLVEGHTDDTGEDDKNQVLSEKRADAVKHYASSMGVATSRISTAGYGEKQPVADNSTTAGKAQNRRVEVAIMANKKLKKAAEKGEI
jgi:outer membrane protein OmpA-like peptidoglycan-associated protein